MPLMACDAFPQPTLTLVGSGTQQVRAVEEQGSFFFKKYTEAYHKFIEGRTFSTRQLGRNNERNTNSTPSFFLKPTQNISQKTVWF
jgi:hypothetical protein